MVRRQRYQKSIYKKKKSIRSHEFHGWQVVTEVGKSERKSELLKMKGRRRKGSHQMGKNQRENRIET
jgi:cobyrinic acid a,c-diamide synthase